MKPRTPTPRARLRCESLEDRCTPAVLSPDGFGEFVQTLYRTNLGRDGDLANPADAGRWVDALNNGAGPADVAHDIRYSAEALGRTIDGLY